MTAELRSHRAMGTCTAADVIAEMNTLADPAVRRELSSGVTWFVKFVLPVFAAVLAALVLGTGEVPEVAWERWAALLGLSAIVFAAARVGLPLKKVRLGDGRLHVSNFRREIDIPLADVERLVLFGEFRGKQRQTAVLMLRRNGPFGRRIQFLPKSPEAVALLERSLEELREDPVLGLGETPVDTGVTGGSTNHDLYLTSHLDHGGPEK